MYLPIDGPVVYKSLSVTTTATEVKVGGSVLDDRVAIMIQPIDGVVYLGFDSSVTTSNGIKIAKELVFPFECGPRVSVYLITSSGTVDVRIVEFA